MIATLTGTLRSLSTEKGILDVNGVGYLIHISALTSRNLTLGAGETLFTSLVVREDSLTLFGFLTQEEKDIFELLQTVSGIGPKVALTITGSLTSDALFAAIAQEDLATIEKIPGIGKKGAQRLVLELKGKISHRGKTAEVPTRSVKRELLLEALIGLGFSSRDADKAISATWSSCTHAHEDPEAIEVSELLKMALQSGNRA